MANEKPLAYNMLLNGLLKVSSLLFPVIAFPYASRVLLPEGVGKVSFATSVVAYFTMLAQMGIPTYGIQACAKVRDSKEALSRTVHELLGIGFAMTVFSYLLFGILLFTVPRMREEKELFLVVSATVLLKTMGMEWLYQAIEEYTYITVRALVFKIIAVAGMFFLVRSESDYIYYGMLTVFAAQASSVLNFFHARKYIFMKPLGSYHIKKHIKSVLVLFAMSCAIMVYTNLDTFMLGLIKHAQEVGYYNAAVNVKLVLTNLITAGGTALLPRTSYYLEKGMGQKFFRTSKKAVHVMLWVAGPIAVYFMLFARESISLISGPAFEGAVLPMQIIMPTVLPVALTNIMGVQMLVAMGREKDTLYSVAAGAAVDFLLNAVFIPAYGAAGAAAGTLAAEVMVLVVQFVCIRKAVGNPFLDFPWKGLFVACLAASLSALWVKLPGMPAIFALALSAVLYFGTYGGLLLWRGEPLVTEMWNQVKGIFLAGYHFGSKERGGRMKNYYLRNIADDCIRHWKKIVLAVIFCTLACGALGYWQSRHPGKAAGAQQEEIDIYNGRLKVYDQQIADARGSIERYTAEKETAQAYLDEAYYMKLDPYHLLTLTTQYQITDLADPVQLGNIFSSLLTYLDNGGLMEYLEKEYEPTQAAYLRELMSWGTSGNLLTLTVIHYDEAGGKKILETLDKALQSQVPAIRKTQCTFSLKQLSSRSYIRRDTGVADQQKAKQDIVRNHDASILDCNSRILSYQNDKNIYMEEEEPSALRVSGNSFILRYAIFGTVLGIVLPMFIFSLRYLVSDKIRSGKEVANANVPVISCTGKSGGKSPDLAMGLLELGLLAEKHQAEGVYLNLLCEDGAVQKAAGEITDALREKGISVESGTMAGADAASLKKMMGMGHSVLLVKAGTNTYPQLAGQIRACKKFGVTMWGCIVIE